MAFRTQGSIHVEGEPAETYIDVKCDAATFGAGYMITVRGEDAVAILRLHVTSFS